ncbi:TetR/AcrR family transcriptional regulator [Paracoccus shanxieyensis]|uniref:TetR family transcriptional regulator n=1 Tax=Paracoccus shanxieyensis TaxID=2675752 RepID=A0A6L6IXC2_9RHOB|nr:TetR/AcrR family transcriptional regulator [Paracoccus shanxieyensis]MTH63254.1 TetR family transcriptional regulator [Paracoccus shanxieyensis]MTH87168.1 TetR family transcriptional regulator [Paracoccus shanxieyensis]
MDQPEKTYLGTNDRRTMIADAARALIVENGYAALRTRDVAARVGINISTLHYHVQNKAALVVLVADTTRDAFLALLPPAADPARPARAQLRAEAEAYFLSLRDRPELAACFAQLMQLAGSQPEIATHLDGFAQGWCQRYAEILAIGRSQGVFRADLQPLAAALAMTGALTAFASRGPTGLAMFWPVFDELERGFLISPDKERAQ